MEGAEELGPRRTVDSKDLQRQSKALDRLTDRVEDLQLDSSPVRSAMTCIAAAKEADDVKIMSESDGEEDGTDEELYEGEDGFNEELYERVDKMDDLEDDLEFEEYARSTFLNAAKRLTEDDTEDEDDLENED